jgi:hypothetical protein
LEQLELLRRAHKPQINADKPVRHALPYAPSASAGITLLARRVSH